MPIRLGTATEICYCLCSIKRNFLSLSISNFVEGLMSAQQLTLKKRCRKKELNLNPVKFGVHKLVNKLCGFLLENLPHLVVLEVAEVVGVVALVLVVVVVAAAAVVVVAVVVFYSCS